jgi:GH15 family glucan-1,4-alpha-glucosidase
MAASSARIEDHAVIGNLATVALVATDGTIDFNCYPDFDSPTIFASLLDAEKGGCFSVLPAAEALRVKQMYLPDTNVLTTRFFTADGVGEIVDFMPLQQDGTITGYRIVRILRAVRGTVRFQLRCAPRFDYARKPHRLEIERGIARFFPEDDTPPLRLTVDGELHRNGDDAECELHLKAGEHTKVILETDREHDDGEQLDEQDLGLHATVSYWRKWAERSEYRGRWREMVTRSALTLKLLMSQKHGSMIAAATFGLPEVVGGTRNWDYRYTWIRDAGFTVYAFMRLGYVEEAAGFVDWVQALCTKMRGDGSLQIMYGIDGRADLHEEELPHLSGHQGSRPVRIGNGAFDQTQLDIYGTLLDAVYIANKRGAPSSLDAWTKLTGLVDFVCENWQQPDEGIWEFRGEKRHFLHSRLMCWVAIDRAFRLAVKRSLPAPLDRWRKVRDDIHADITGNFWNEERQCFVQSKGSKALDGSILLMPMMRFIAPHDPKWLSTLKAIGEDLVEEPFVYRYRAEQVPSDGLIGNEGTFTACSFWYVEALARSGQLTEARMLFERMLGSANHVGLYAEEFGNSGEQLGNFPQALSHLALISAAVILDRELTGGTPAAWSR